MAVNVRVLPTSPSDWRKKWVNGFVVPRRWIVASDTTFRWFDTIGTASETSNRSVMPNVTNVVKWLTVASMELTVVTTSCRPPSS